jgi:hypothetical protein
MKMFSFFAGLLMLVGMSFACKADASYSFFVSMPNMPAGSTYGDWLESSKNSSTTSSISQESISIDTGRFAGKSEGSALDLGFFTQFASPGTRLKSTPAAFMLIVR